LKHIDILNNINKINIETSIETNKTVRNVVKYYQDGGCYIFAKRLKQSCLHGNIRYLLNEHHFIVEINNKLYDTTGNVTNKYSKSKFITEEEFLKREKLVQSIQS